MKKEAKIILTAIFSICLAMCSFVGFNSITAKAQTDMEKVKASSENVISLDAVGLTGNLRTPGATYGIGYADGKFVTSYVNDWERSSFVFTNKYLNTTTVKVGDNEVATNAIRTYIGATFNYSSAGEYQTIGVMFGKRMVDGITTYYGLTVEPGRGFVGEYSFDVNAEGSPVKERSGPFSYTPGEFKPNTDYKIEILLDPINGITVVVGGVTYAEDVKNVYECNDSMIGLTPITGLNISSVAGNVFDFTLVYEDAKFVEDDIWTMEYAREYDSVNLVNAATVTVGENLHRTGNFGVKYENGSFISSTNNVWERAFFALHNDYLDTESVIKDGTVINSSTAMWYSSAILNWSAAGEYQNFGVFFGRLKKETVTTYYGFLVEPGRGISGVYTLDVDANGKPVAERSGPLSYNFGTYTANTDYKVELLMKPTGLTVYVGGQLIVSDMTSVYESNDTLLGITPMIGLNYCSVTGSVSDFVFKYLDGAQAYIDYTAVKNTKAENLVIKEVAQMSKNLISESDYGIYIDNGKFYSEVIGNGESAAFILKNKYLDLEKIYVSGQETSTNNVSAYVSANLKYYELSEDSMLGVVIGQRKIDEETVYYAITISPEDGKMYLVSFNNTSAGNYVEGSLNKTELATGLIFETETMFTVETIISPLTGISIYINGQEVVEKYVGENILGITPKVGYFCQDINATSAKLNLKYFAIDAFESEEKEVEETYPEEGGRPEINTDIILPEIETVDSQGCQSSIGSASVLASLLFASAFIIRKKRRN